MSGETRPGGRPWWRSHMGSWGHGPLDNDTASDWKWDIGESILNEILARLKSDNPWNQYEAIGMWDFMRQRLYTQYSFFTVNVVKAVNAKCRAAAKKLYEDSRIDEQYNNPFKVRAYLAQWLEEICSEDEMKMGIIESYTKDLECFERVDIDYNSRGTGTKIKVTDGTCYNVYRLWLDNDVLAVEDAASEKFDEPFFTCNIADPESQQRFAKLIIEKHNLE